MAPPHYPPSNPARNSKGQSMTQQIKFDRRNYRKHSDLNKSLIRKSLQQLGAGRSIVIDSEGEIIGGNGVYQESQALGIPVKVIETDGSELVVVKRTDLKTSDEKRKKLAVMDNSTSDTSEFEHDLLQADFDRTMLEEMGVDWVDPPVATAIEDVVEDEPPAEAPAMVEPGDIWQLGNHRLLCGDSTDQEQIARLMDGHKADLVVTDPPYNMNYTGAGNTEKAKRKGIMNDNMPENEFKVFLTNAYKAAMSAMKPGASAYVFYKEMGHGTFITSMLDSGMEYKQELIWVKDQLVLGGAKYQGIYEPFLYGYKPGGDITWHGGRKQVNVIEDIEFMSKDEIKEAYRALVDSLNADIIRNERTKKNDLHPTMKPIKLLSRLIFNSSDPGQNVLDLFGGSGSTLMACEQMNRNCYMNELDPKYCDVIIARWEEFTGKKAKKVAGNENN